MPARTEEQAQGPRRPGRRAAAKQRAAAARGAQRRAVQRRRLRTAAVAALLAGLVGAGIAVQAARSTSEGPTGAPKGTVDGVGLAVGSADAPVTVEVYEDFLCPACARFEQTAGPVLREMADAGRVRVVYRPMAFLDRYSTSRYSTRALNAAGCAADAGRFAAMHDALFAAQPAEGGPGLSDDRLVRIGRQAGVTGDGFDSCVRDRRYEKWTQQATDVASKAGVVGTPTVLVAGQHLADPSPAALRAAVTTASG